MVYLLPPRLFRRPLHELPAALAASAMHLFSQTQLHPQPIRSLESSLSPEEESTLLRTIGWLTAGMGALAVGLFVGRELRQRYKFNRRTPYDFYAHSGDPIYDHTLHDTRQDMEFGVGI